MKVKTYSIVILISILGWFLLIWVLNHVYWRLEPIYCPTCNIAAPNELEKL